VNECTPLVDGYDAANERKAFIPFDDAAGVVPNLVGRVVRPTTNEDTGEFTTQAVHGLYVCGWLKRGPTGIIGTNLVCAEETVAAGAYTRPHFGST
jgi:NADPH-dependent glutamate synthase beta subunit-like oxidoreductase